MCVDSLHCTTTHDSFRCLFITPYENQVRLIFDRLNALIDKSPIIKKRVVSRTKTPYSIKFINGSEIAGFTTGAGTGNGGASIRGQRADKLYLDESDYMIDADFDSVLAIANERVGIGIFLSSTPTGARRMFYKCCTDPKLGFKEFHFPSTMSPNWCKEKEEEARASMSENGYVHEILAEFGTEEAGVFDKDKVDKAMTFDCFAYDELTYSQKERVKNEGLKVKYFIPSKGERPYKPNLLRVLAADWDKVGASSSLLVLEYDTNMKKFRVLRRVEVPRAEYSFDKAVQLIIELNDIYDPSFIYVDRGMGKIVNITCMYFYRINTLIILTPAVQS